MFGPKWPFLLLYGSHDMRHTSISRVDRLSTDPWDLGRHSLVYGPKWPLFMNTVHEHYSQCFQFFFKKIK